MKEFLKSAFTKLFEMEAQALQFYEKAADGDMKSLELAARYQEQLEAHDFYSIDTAIDRVANGLGLLAIGLDRPIAEMSGGQRAKVILAKMILYIEIWYGGNRRMPPCPFYFFVVLISCTS